MATLCPLCQRPRERVVIREHGYQGVRCDHCGVIYISPRPSPAEVAACYQGEGDSWPTSGGMACGPLARWVRRLPARQTLALLKSYCPSGTLLELGPGWGDFLLAAQAVGYRVFGLEINPQRARFIREQLKLPCTETPLADSPWPGRRFDLVYHRDVLSHFYDPVAEFQLLHDILKENGLLVFETGNLGEVEERYLTQVPTFDYPEHLFFFGEASLRQLLTQTGFQLLTLQRYDLELYFRLERLVKAMRRHRPRVAGTVSASAGKPGGKRLFRAKAVVWLGYEFAAEYLLKYQVGRWAQRPGRPQSLIVIARRI
ncbi:MAG: class I SAM-dependent methyltransferase [Desulfobacca sp.]|uniref:class I SAM-dependent methyltransferase n=1 Tax=Desulfobacca sp. TaxID=2067990 RepID=UPI0040490B28